MATADALASSKDRAPPAGSLRIQRGGSSRLWVGEAVARRLRGCSRSAQNLDIVTHDWEGVVNFYRCRRHYRKAMIDES
jgi:hypothetical protein